MNDLDAENARKDTGGRIRVYRALSLGLCLIFAAVGILFLFFPNAPSQFFNDLSRDLGMTACAPVGTGLYHVLGVGYMYVVTLLAFLMYRHPANRHIPWLMINAKGASALLSAYMFFVHGPCLILMANAIVDGLIALGLAAFCLRLNRGSG